MVWFPVFLATNLLWVLVVFYTERKVSAFMQDRYGPMQVGKYGTLQAFADLLKLLQKEQIQVQGQDNTLVLLAPLLLFATTFAGYVFIPISPDVVPAASLYSAAFMLLALVSLDVIGILMAGWGSNSKYPMIGAMRALAQIVSYEIPVGLAVLVVAILCQSLSLQEITLAQTHYASSTLPSWTGNYLFGLHSMGISTDNVGGFLTWNIFRFPLLIITFVAYYVATLAESNRAPFDLPEGESELVGGFHTEYSGFRWAIFFLAEYTMQLLLAALGVVLFLGGWYTPFPNIGPVTLANWTSGAPGTWAGNLWGVFWFILKILTWGASHVWVRWTFPRLRLDKMMYLCWQVLIPVCLASVLLAGLWRLLML